MEFTWSETKRSANLAAHGVDFVDAQAVFAGSRMTGSPIAGIPVSVVHTESEHEVRIISFRQATKREGQIYFSEIQD